VSRIAHQNSLKRQAIGLSNAQPMILIAEIRQIKNIWEGGKTVNASLAFHFDRQSERETAK